MMSVMGSLWMRLLAAWNTFLVWTGIRKLSFRDKLPPEARVHFDEVVKLFKNPTSSAVKTPPGALLQQLNPNRSNLWIVEIEGISSFLASGITPPSIIRSFDKQTGASSVSFSSVYVTFYDVMGDSTVARLASLMNKESFELVVKLVDPIGTVVEVWKMDAHAIAIHPMVVLDYSRAEPVVWQLECDCLNWKI